MLLKDICVLETLVAIRPTHGATMTDRAAGEAEHDGTVSEQQVGEKNNCSSHKGSKKQHQGLVFASLGESGTKHGQFVQRVPLQQSSQGHESNKDSSSGDHEYKQQVLLSLTFKVSRVKY